MVLLKKELIILAEWMDASFSNLEARKHVLRSLFGSDYDFDFSLEDVNKLVEKLKEEAANQ